MKRYGQTLLLLLALLAASCTKEENTPPVPEVSRTLLVYMAGDNNLAANGTANLAAITEAMRGYDRSDARLLVYIDLPGQNPRLIEAAPQGPREWRVWPSAHNSASAETLAEVIGLTRRIAPARRYGLVMWSHGVGWLPSSATNYLTRSTLPQDGPWPATKWFGQDVSAQPMGYIDTDDLADAIPQGMFDYLLFDACYMASVEVLYALRKKVDYIVSSPTEVVSEGFPYGQITTALLAQTPDLEAVCRTYQAYYATHPKPSYRSASVSLVETARLEALAAATATLYGEALQHDPALFARIDPARLQPLDRYRQHFLFDLGSISDELLRQGAVSARALAEWRSRLAGTVVYEAHTSAFFDLPLNRCCGLSAFVPLGAYADLNRAYAKLEWTSDIYPQKTNNNGY